MELNKIYQGNSLKVLKSFKDNSIDCCVTSPPYYGLRDYGTEPTTWPAVEYCLFGFTITIKPMKCSLGLESTPEEFIGHMILIFSEVFRALKKEGTVWMNMGDSYAGSMNGQQKTSNDIWVDNSMSAASIHTLGNYEFSKKSKRGRKENGVKRWGGGNISCTGNIKPKDLIGIPWMLAFALREYGWYLRQDIIWNKPNPMPESVTDRCTKSHEYIFLLSKSAKYYYDAEAIKTSLATSSIPRLLQDTDHQKGSARAYGGKIHNGNMKAVVSKSFTAWQTGPGSHSTLKHNTEEGRNIEKTKRTIHQEESASYGINGKGFIGHSGNFDAKGNLIGNGKANKRSVWTIPTMPYSDAHFATFPEKLIVDCIKAGSSEFGCCSKCGKPYIRDFTKELIPTSKASYNSKIDIRDINADKQDQGSNRMKDGHKPGWVNKTETVGWSPSCKCNSNYVPSVILDPFIGAGTTALVARKLNRNFVGIELNHEYIKIAETRLQNQLGMFK